MSGSLLKFLGFCVVLVLFSVAAVWYVGPSVAAIVLDSERREQPYHLLQLVQLEVRDPASRTADAPDYRRGFLELAANDDGDLLWQSSAAEIYEGSLLRGVDSIQLFRFGTGGDLVQLLTGGRFRALAQQAQQLHLFGATEGPAPLSMTDATVLVLYQSRPQAPPDVLGQPGQSGWLAQVEEAGGVVRWHADLETLRGGMRWNRVLMLQFPDLPAVERWRGHPVTVTERAIAGKHLKELLLLVTEGSARAW